MKPSYQRLCTEFYDLTMPEADSNEVSFYRKFLQGSEGPFIEAMCGSGRLLIPLLREGFVVEGVDNSSFMLESCRQRCKKEGLSAQLDQQPIETLSLPKKYKVIFISIGSFQLVNDRTLALNTLKNLRNHLLPGGKLVIENFIPWDGIKTAINGAILADHSRPLSSEAKILTLDGSEIRKYTTVTLHLKDQLVENHTTYEKWKGDKLLLEEEEEYLVRWYYRYEMELLLEKAGFSSIKIIDESFKENPQALVYISKV